MSQWRTVMPHPSWWVPQKNRAVDKKGVAVALAFLVALGALAGGRGEKRDRTEDPIDRTNVSASLDTRSAGTTTLADQGAVMDHRLSSFSMPHLSGPFEPGTLFLESQAAYQKEGSTGRPCFGMPLPYSRPPKTGQLPLHELSQDSSTPCPGQTHPSTPILLTEQSFALR
jgi:hypothetical protein